MTTESASERQKQWALAVRRSFGISDQLTEKDARRALIGNLQDQLKENGWHTPTRGICEPLVDVLLALESSGNPDDQDAANRLLNREITVVDPERLVLDPWFQDPPEVVAVARQTLNRVGQYVRQRPGPWPSS